ncbi:MAG: phage protease [Rhodospirillales bacterium]
MDHDQLTAKCAITLPGGVPEWVHVFPLGKIDARDGRKFEVVDPAGLVQASIDPTMDLVVDYEHQTDNAEKNGQKAPAAGWIKDLENRADGIWARVEWTPDAAKHLRDKEYRYLSPTFLFDKATKKVTKILRAALTNHPAFQLTALATQESVMEKLLKALAAIVGLDEKADEKTILAKVEEIAKASAATKEAKESGDQLVKALCTALKLPEDSKPDVIVKTITDLATAKAAAGDKADPGKEADGKDKPGQYAPIEMVTELAKQLTDLQANVDKDKVAEAVDKAMAAGKITPAMKDWAVGFARKDMAAFETFVEKQPVIVKAAANVPGTQPNKAGAQLDEEELATCRLTGVDPKKFKEARDKLEENAQ